MNIFTHWKRFLISPFRFFVRRELIYFFATGAAALLVIQMFSFYSGGMQLAKKVEVSAGAVSREISGAKQLLSRLDIQGIRGKLTGIRDLILDLKNEVSNFSPSNISSNASDSVFASMHQMLSAGQHVVNASGDILSWGQFFKSVPFKFFSDDPNDESFKTAKIRETEEAYFNSALFELEQALSKTKSISQEFLPEKGKRLLAVLEDRIDKIRTGLHKIRNIMPLFYQILGDPYPQRYVILLQNENEIRATGGFIGSYILVKVNDGVVETSFHDIYENDNQFVSSLAAPPGLEAVVDTWSLRDSNYYPDFPVSAKKFAWFLDQSKGPTVDGVMAVDIAVVKRVFEQISPIYLKEYDVELNTENFAFVLSYLVEGKFSENGGPKNIIREIIPKFTEALSGNVDEEKLMRIFEDGVRSKHISLYFENETIQKLLDLLGMSHKMADEDYDYLQVVHTSIGGNKSDAFMRQKIVHRTEIEADYEVVDKVYLEREHLWGGKEEILFSELHTKLGSGNFEEWELRKIMGYGANRSFVRIYVPNGSELLQVEGLEYDEVETARELGKTVFRFISPRIYPGETNRMTVTYRLPEKLIFNGKKGIYTLLWQKQMGSKNDEIVKKVSGAGGLKITEFFPESVLGMNDEEGQVVGLLGEDRKFEVIVRSDY